MHLHDDQILDALTASADADARQHLSACPLCGEAAATWQRVLPELRALAAETVEETEMHRLRVLFRELAPQRSGLATWVATLLRCSPQPAAAVRGGSTEMMELAAGPYRVVMQLNPHSVAGTVSLHGQLFGDGEHPPGRGRVAFAAESGVGFVGDIDGHGEFHVPCLPAGMYSASWWTPGGRIKLEDIMVGADDQA